MPQPVRLRATVEHVIDHAIGLRSLVLRPERPVPRFRPGQFLHLAVDEWDPSQHWPDSRPFSLASPPEDRGRLRITVSEVGRFTRRLMATEPGDEVWIKLPYGDFVVECQAERPALLVAGGTGVAPFISLVTSAVPVEAPVVLLYGARRPDLLIYREFLDEASQRHPGFRWEGFAESGKSDGLHHGSLSLDSVLQALQSLGGFATSTVYLSGPPAMIAALSGGLSQAGVEAERIRVDAWE